MRLGLDRWFVVLLLEQGGGAGEPEPHATVVPVPPRAAGVGVQGSGGSSFSGSPTKRLAAAPTVEPWTTTENTTTT